MSPIAATLAMTLSANSTRLSTCFVGSVVIRIESPLSLSIQQYRVEFVLVIIDPPLREHEDDHENVPEPFEYLVEFHATFLRTENTCLTGVPRSSIASTTWPILR